jgi:hypothetical protein
MKRKLCSVLLGALFICTAANAQVTVFGGPQITSARYLVNDIKQPTESKTGFAAGVALRSQIEGPVYLIPMLYYSKKGYDVKFNRRASPPDTAARNNNTSIHAIEFAPLVQINLSKKESYLFLRVGPAFDIAISGTERFDSAANKTVTRKMIFGFGDYSYITTSVNAQLGFQHESGLSFFAHYAYGIGSLNNADNGPKIYHTVAGVAVGWRFGKKG